MAFGQSFMPGADEETGVERKPGAAPIQEAIRVLSLRMPRVVGAGGISPQPLLNSMGAGGLNVQGGLEQFLQMLFGQMPGQGSQQMQPMSAPGAMPGQMPGAGGMQAPGMGAGAAPPPRVVPGEQGDRAKFGEPMPSPMPDMGGMREPSADAEPGLGRALPRMGMVPQAAPPDDGGAAGYRNRLDAFRGVRTRR
jgi:hypothetical protein